MPAHFTCWSPSPHGSLIMQKAIRDYAPLLEMDEKRIRNPCRLSEYTSIRVTNRALAARLH
jgi:hypothetical protein